MEHIAHRQHIQSRKQRQQQQQQNKEVKRSYLSKLQIAVVLFAAFVYRLASEHQSDWELSPLAYFDLDGGANADFVTNRLILTPIPNTKSAQNDVKNDDKQDEMAWVTHAGQGWLVGLNRLPLHTSKRTLATWPHRVLARVPLDGAATPLSLDAVTVGRRLFLIVQSATGIIRVLASTGDEKDDNQRQLKQQYSLNPLTSLSPLLLSSYEVKPLTMSVIRAHCRLDARVFACLLIVTSYRLVDKVRSFEQDFNQTAADLLPPVTLAFNLLNGTLVWQNSPQNSDIEDGHDFVSKGVSHYWKLEWARHLLTRRLVSARSFDSVLPVYRDVLPFTWRSDVDAELMTSCLYCDISRRRRDGNVLALRLGDWIDLLDPSSGARLHRLRLDGRRGAYDVINDSQSSWPMRVGTGLNCTAEAASIDDGEFSQSRLRIFNNLCDARADDGASFASAAAAAAAVPLLLPLPAGQNGGWAVLLAHLLGRPKPSGLVLFQFGDGVVSAHDVSDGSSRWRGVTQSRWDAKNNPDGPFLVSWPLSSLSSTAYSSQSLAVAAVAVLGNDRLTVLDAADGRILASHSLPCSPAAPPIPIIGDSDGHEMALACKRMLLRFQLRPLPTDWHWTGLLCLIAFAACLAVAFLLC